MGIEHYTSGQSLRRRRVVYKGKRYTHTHSLAIRIQKCDLKTTFSRFQQPDKPMQLDTQSQELDTHTQQVSSLTAVGCCAAAHTHAAIAIDFQCEETKRKNGSQANLLARWLRRR